VPLAPANHGHTRDDCLTRADPDVARLAVQHSLALTLLLDADGLIRYPAACHLLQWPVDALLGSAWLDMLDAGSQRKGRALLAAARQGILNVFEQPDDGQRPGGHGWLSGGTAEQ